jgi:hypothetical protein
MEIFNAYLRIAGHQWSVLCPLPPANKRILVHHDGAHGVTRPTICRFESRPRIKSFPREMKENQTGL